MIYLHPESDLSLSIMVLGAKIIKLLQPKKKSKDQRPSFQPTEDILKNFLKGDSKRTPNMFLNALTFLYIGGLIERKGYTIRLTPKQMQGKLF